MGFDVDLPLACMCKWVCNRTLPYY